MYSRCERAGVSRYSLFRYLSSRCRWCRRRRLKKASRIRSRTLVCGFSERLGRDTEGGNSAVPKCAAAPHHLPHLVPNTTPNHSLTAHGIQCADRMTSMDMFDPSAMTQTYCCTETVDQVMQCTSALVQTLPRQSNPTQDVQYGEQAEVRILPA